MIPFNTDVKDDLSLIYGRDIIIEELKSCAERAENVGIIGSRRFGKSCLLKSMEKFLRKNSSKAYPLYFDAKHEGILNNTDKVYSRLTALFASKMCKGGLLKEGDYRIGRNFVVHLSSDKNDIEEQLGNYGSERQREALLTMSKYLKRNGFYLLLLIDEIEYLFLNSLSKPADFYKIRTWASTGEPIKFWIAGIASWNDITTGVGSSELSGGLEKIMLPPLRYKDFYLLWENECRLIENKEKRKCIMSMAKEVFDASGGVPFYAKTIGKELLKTDYPHELPSSSYTVLRDHFAKITKNQFLKENERKYLMKLAKDPIVFDGVVPDEIESLKEKGLVVEENGSFVIPIRFFREYLLSSSIETGDASNSCNVKEEIPILVDEIFRLRDNVCKIWTKHELWTTLRTDGKSYPPFVSSMEDYKEINALKQISNDEASYGSFAGALHRVYYEGSKKSMNLPKGFGPWERYWFPGESVSEFAMMVNVNRHMFLHREYEHRENISMSDEDFLKIINKGKRPETPKDFMLMQYHLLQKCKEELHRMLDFLFEEVKK